MNDRYHILTTVLAVIGAIAAILLAIWAIYLFFAPKYYIGYDEEAGEENESGFFNLFDPETSSFADTLPEIIQEAVSPVRFTLKDNRIPSIKRSEMDDLVEILIEKNLLHAVAKDGKDITKDLEVTFEKVKGKDNVYKVTFTAEYQGEKAEFESEVTVTD